MQHPAHPSSRRPLAAMVLAAGLALAGCAQPTPPPATVAEAAPTNDPHGELVRSRRDLARTRICRVSRVAGGASMRVSNDGGWCAVDTARINGTAFKGARILAQPAHGALRVRQLRNGSLVEYEPTPGYVGQDSFTAALAQRGAFRVNVTVVN